MDFIDEMKNMFDENNDSTYMCRKCRKHFKGWGNNPYPLYNSGRVCDKCNKCVMEERLNIMLGIIKSK